MQRFQFWYAPTGSIAWTFNREPAIGEEVILGDRGVYRVTGRVTDKRALLTTGPGVLALECERVRDTTFEDIREQRKRGSDGHNYLP